MSLTVGFVLIFLSATEDIDLDCGHHCPNTSINIFDSFHMPNPSQGQRGPPPIQLATPALRLLCYTNNGSKFMGRSRCHYTWSLK
ncbi:hypothetical protein FKM82_030630 [Ascaphus truei]